MQKTYRIKKILNNNVVVAVNNFQEVIIVGLGIGFNAKVNQKADPRKIEKIFELKQEDAIRATQLVKDIPESMFFEVYRILENQSKDFNLELDAHAYVTIIDHINFAMIRLESGQEIRNLMSYDLQFLYEKEYQFADHIRKEINKLYNTNLPKDETGFLTMHIVNGVNPKLNNKSGVLTDMVWDCLNIIRDTYLIPLKLDDVNTQRIMIHLKMLLQRVMSNQQVDFSENVLYNVIEEFESAYKCACKIQDYIENRLQVKINSQELVYMTIHLNRLEMISK